MSEQPKTILVMAGGTGGHVFPALACAEVLQQRGVPVQWMGTGAGIEARLVPQAGIQLHSIDVQGLRGKGRLSLLLAPLRLLKALVQAIGVLRKVRPAAVLGMGGFAAGPGALAAALLGIPLVIHEQNARAGLTNRIAARLADRILEAFGGAFASTVETEVVGNPVRGAILQLPAAAARYASRAQAPLQVLVIGGSLGAQAINELIPAALAEIAPGQRPHVWHQTGERHLQATLQHYRQHQVDANVVAFIDDMASAYGWADLVICRAGALTVSELAIAGVAALLVPYPFAVDDHQSANGRQLEQVGGAWLIQQKQVDVLQLKQLMDGQVSRQKLAQMAEKARSIGRPQASRRVADVCMEIMK